MLQQNRERQTLTSSELMQRIVWVEKRQIRKAHDVAEHMHDKNGYKVP